jgi:hypothetical protein
MRFMNLLHDHAAEQGAGVNAGDDVDALPKMVHLRDSTPAELTRLFDDPRFLDAVLAGNNSQATSLVKNDYPELESTLVNQLGYDTVTNLLRVSGFEDLNSPGALDAFKEQVNYRLGLPESDSAVFQQVGDRIATGALNDNAKFVELDFGGGQRVTFDGERAGEAANQFALVYNESPLFRNNFDHVLHEVEGNYNFHTYNENSGRVAFNLNEGGETNLNTRHLGDGIHHALVHEIAHELHHDGHGLTGQVHSREQTAFVAAVLNDLENRGFDLGNDVDDGDYGHDLSVFGPHSNYPYQQQDPQRFGELQATFNGIVDANNKGDTASAIDLWESIPADESIQFSAIEPEGRLNHINYDYNVRDLLVQELLFTADSDDLFNTHKGDAQTALEKDHLGNFFEALVVHDPGNAQRLHSAANQVFIDLGTELPGARL